VDFGRPASDAGRSASPASDGGNASDDRTDSKGKSKGKGKKAGEGSLPFLAATQLMTNYIADEGDFTLKRKRVLEFIFPGIRLG
jgi:hypothetical protein